MQAQSNQTQRRPLGLLPALGAACVAAMLGNVACATTPGNLNPGGLDAERLTQVSAICQSVLGLKPDERLTGGTWHGDELDYYTSKFRGCVTSLSDSLQAQVRQQAMQQAEAQCRAEGHPAGSPELALCELKASQQPSAAATQVQTGLASAAQPDAVKPGSFYAVSPGEVRRREQTACAALGLPPSDPAFDSCVRHLTEIFFTIDNPIT